MSRRTTHRSLRLGLAALLVAALTGSGALSAQAESYVAITGSGSTWSQNALDQWRRNVASNYGMTVNFSGTGSSAGRSDFIKGAVDFAVSEIPFQSSPEDGSAPEKPPRGYAYLPIVAGGTSFMYNLKISGKRVTDLQLSGEVIARIFTGQITNWNDPAIAGLNPTLALPSKPITPVVRSDGSGSTAQFTQWMTTQFPSVWTTGMTSQFPASRVANSKAQSGSLGVSGYVKQDYGEGAITYVEYSYAMNAGFPVVKVQNASGAYVEPSATNVEIALTHARINSDLTQILDDVYRSPEANAYPVSSYSYMIVPTEVGGTFSATKGYTLGEFIKYVVCDGQKQAGTLGYSPLPMNLVQAAYEQIAKIPGAQVGAFDATTCSNKGAAAEGEANPNPVGTSPDAADPAAPGAATSAEAAAAAAAAAAASDAVYDANGNLISGSTAGGASALSSPFTLASSNWGPAQNGMLIAGLLLVGAALLPPVLLRSSRRRR